MCKKSGLDHCPKRPSLRCSPNLIVRVACRIYGQLRSNKLQTTYLGVYLSDTDSRLPWQPLLRFASTLGTLSNSNPKYSDPIITPYNPNP